MSSVGILKKPQNLLEGPIYPNILKGPPQFKWSGKHWMVDAGKTLIATQDLPNTYDYQILVQSRAYNKQNAYGVSSHRYPINEEFRPPLITMEDTMPLCRIPRPIVVPRINPGTAFDSNTGGYTAQNERPSEIQAYMTDRIKPMESRATFFCPLDAPIDNSVLPDLDRKLPATSAGAGFTFPSGPAITEPQSIRTTERYDPRFDAGHAALDIVTPTSGLEHLTLDHNRPQVSAHAGYTSHVSHGITHQNIELFNNRPQTSASAGFVSPVTSDGQTRTDFLFDEKFNSSGSVRNPAPNFQSDNQQTSTTNVKFQDRPSYSYATSVNIPYADSNERSGKPAFQQKAQASRTYKGYRNNPYVPRAGIDQPRASFK